MEKLGKSLWNLFEKIFKGVVNGFFRIFKKKLSDEKWNKIMQFVKFGMVGVSNTMISWVVYYVLLLFGVYWLIASVVGFVVSVFNSFFWNNKYVFVKEEGEVRNPWLALIKMFLAYAFSGLILNNLLMWVWIDVFGISAYLTPVINLFITVPINYIINKLWAFRGKNVEEIQYK